MGKKFRKIIKIDTEKITTIDGVELITRSTLEALNSFLDEKILCLNKKDINISSGFTQEKDLVEKLEKLIVQNGIYIERPNVEEDNNYIQIIPIAIFRYDDKFLFLRKKEKESGKRFHDKYMIWAGGHVREEDSNGNNVLLKCLKREIEEELKICLPPKFTPLGTVYDKSNVKSSNHLGIVYLAEIDNPNVAIAINVEGGEFRERKGKSISGKFMSFSELDKYYDKIEMWSKYILKHFGFNTQHNSLFPPDT